MNDHLVDISNFSNTSNYLPILVACINIDLTVLFLLHIGILQSKWIIKWYKKYKLSACIADTSILFLCITITRFLYHYFFTTFSIWLFILLAIGIQMAHDCLFYLFLLIVPSRFSKILNFLKGYAADSGARALLSNSLMIALACLFASGFASYSFNENIIFLIVSLYFIPYMV